MKRRSFLKSLGAVALVNVLPRGLRTKISGRAKYLPANRVRPGEPGWPTPASWEKLNQDVGGHLITVQSPAAACKTNNEACQEVFTNLQNPYYIGDNPGATETSGWIDAWTSSPSVYAVAARNTADIAAAVNFARENNLRLVVKGGGHSYQGTSNSADSLLIWTRAMNEITLIDSFVGQGCAGKQEPRPAVTIGAGAMWVDVYNAVTTVAGRYVQGGGCATVGVAGLIQSGGFGSFSKNFGLAAAGLLEAEVVTADGVVRTANICTNPDLFWAIKGGGGGSFGVVARITLRTRELPANFGGVFMKIKAASDSAFQKLISRFIVFYRDDLFNPHWGEMASFQPDNILSVGMVCQGLDTKEAQRVWKPFLEWVRGLPQDYTITSEPMIVTFSARNWWDAEFLKKNFPTMIYTDSRPGAPAAHFWFAGDNSQVGIFMHGYDSVWLPASLLEERQRERLAGALFASSRHWTVSLHFNKGLGGAPADAVESAKDTAMNPAVLDAFALAIIVGGGPPAFPGIAGHEPDMATARTQAGKIAKSTDELRAIVPDAGSYVSEGNFFDTSWQRSYWGPNYPRLKEVKSKYDPDGLFFVHHGVGSEEWSADGFTRLR